MTRRRSLATLLVCLTALTACSAASQDASVRPPVEGAITPVRHAAPARADSFPNEPLGSFSKKRAMTHVRKLANDIGVRVRATGGERRSATYIKKKFASFGYNVRIQKFAVDSGTSRNVVAWWPGARKYPLVVGGHMDSVPTSPGANDNASGVATVLEIARLVAGKRPAKFLRLIAFGSEEFGDDGRHHVGSQVYVDRLGNKGRARLAGMISVDMIADGRPIILGTAGMASEIVARTLQRKIDRAGIATEYRTTCDCSDNGPFERAGIPAAFMWSGDEPDYHSSSDKVRNMSPEDLLRTGRAVRAFVKSLRQGLIDRFRDGR